MLKLSYRPSIFLVLGFLCFLIVWIYWPVVAGKLQNLDISKTRQSSRSRIKPDLSDPERLNVSEPTFSKAGIHFVLDDTRPNTSLWIATKVGRYKADTNFMTWTSFTHVKPGRVFISFRDCKFLDAGTRAMLFATECEITIGAQLKDSNKVVYTKYNASASELLSALDW